MNFTHPLFSRPAYAHPAHMAFAAAAPLPPLAPFEGAAVGGRALAAKRFRLSVQRCAPGKRCFRAWVETPSGEWVAVGQVGSTSPRLAALRVVRLFVHKRGYQAKRVAVDEAKTGPHGKHFVSRYTFSGGGPKLKVKRTMTGKAFGNLVQNMLPTPSAPKPKAVRRAPVKRSRSKSKPKSKSASKPKMMSRPKSKSKSKSAPKMTVPMIRASILRAPSRFFSPVATRKLPTRMVAKSRRGITRARMTYGK